MKKVIAMLAAAALVLGVSSCGDDAVLGKSAAKKAIKKEAVFAKDFATASFDTGYYEVDEDYILKLAQLQAAGVITYKIDNVVEKVQKRNYNYWSGYTYYTVDNEHMFATVEFTDEGRKLVVEKPTRTREDIAKDFKTNEDFEEAMPDYMKSTTDNAEPAPEAVDAPAVAAAEDSAVVEVDSVATEVVEEVVEEVAAPADPNAAYEAAMARVNREEHQVLLGRYKFIKVKEVLCSEEMAKNGVGKCRLLYTFEDKTPFGYVLGAPREGYVEDTEVSFVYYQDLGWTVSDMKE